MAWRELINVRADGAVPCGLAGVPSPALLAPAEVIDKLALW